MGQIVSSFFEDTDQERYDRLTEIYDLNRDRSFFHLIGAETTAKLLHSFNDPSYIKMAAQITDDFGETPLHQANFEKTKTVMESIPKEEREGFVKSLLTKKSRQGNTILDNDIPPEWQHQYEAKVGTFLNYLPLGTNITNSVQRRNALSNPNAFKDHIATTQDLSDLFMGRSSKSDSLKTDFASNLPKYISYASDIMEDEEQVKQISKSEKEIFSIVADAKDLSTRYFQRDLKIGIVVDKEISKDDEGNLKTTSASSIFLQGQLKKESIPSSRETQVIPEDVMTHITSFISNNPRSPSILDSVYKQKSDDGKRKTFLEGLKKVANEEAVKTR